MSLDGCVNAVTSSYLALCFNPLPHLHDANVFQLLNKMIAREAEYRPPAVSPPCVLQNAELCVQSTSLAAVKRQIFRIN